jgi:tetratricopeptide (TPR) repeat protein
MIKYALQVKNIAGILICLFAATCVPVPNPPREPLPTYLNRAEAFVAQRQYSEALKTLEKAAELYPEETQPLIKIGQIYLSRRQWLLAEDAFNRALARNLRDPVATAGLAEVKLNQGDLTRALSLWQETTRLNPDLAGVFTGLGRTHIWRFEFEAAHDAFLTQLTHQSDPEAQWYLAALVAPSDLTAANDYLLAIPAGSSTDLFARRDYLLAALVPFTAESPQAEVAQATGIALTQVGFWPLAVHALTIAAEYPNQSPEEKAETLAFLGHALAQAGRPALDLFEQATALDPGSALPLYFYGIYLRRKGAWRAAEEQFEQAIALDPENAAIYVELAQVKVDQGNFDAAEGYYRAAAKLAEDDPQIQLLRVQFHANRGYRMAEAGIPAAQALIEADEDNAAAYDLLGWMQFLSGDSAEAEKSLRKAVELDPNLISARYHLARYLETEGKVTEAIEQYRQIVEWDTVGIFRDQATKALQRLEQGQ